MRENIVTAGFVGFIQIKSAWPVAAEEAILPVRFQEKIEVIVTGVEAGAGIFGDAEAIRVFFDRKNIVVDHIYEYDLTLYCKIYLKTKEQK